MQKINREQMNKWVKEISDSDDYLDNQFNNNEDYND